MHDCDMGLSEAGIERPVPSPNVWSCQLFGYTGSDGVYVSILSIEGPEEMRPHWWRRMWMWIVFGATWTRIGE